LHKLSEEPDIVAATRPPEAAISALASAGKENPSSLEETVLNDIRETVYQWDVANDRLVWGRNVANIFGADIAARLTCGAAFDALVDPESLTDRHQTVCNSIGVDYGNGVPFEVEYRLRLPEQGGDKMIWVQDRGRWFADGDGRPILARGALRIIDPFGA